MTYTQILLYLTATGSGVILGLVYFLGLWVTVNKIGSSQRPYILIIGSFLVRTVLVLAGFYLLLIHNWIYLVLAMVAFLVTRQWVIQRKGKPSEYIYG